MGSFIPIAESVEINMTEKIAIERKMMKNLFFKNFMFILKDYTEFSTLLSTPVENFSHVEKSV